MEYIHSSVTALQEFWTALKTGKGHTSDISMLIVTTIGVIFSTLAAFFTARAAVATRNSTKVSEAALLHTQNTSRRDEFISQYTILLEQHKEQLNVVKSYLDTEEGKKLLDGLIKGTDHLTAFKTLQGHNIVSPYMRVLYHLLRHINVHYVENATTQDKKLYSSTVRSLIRNDVLFLVAVNASYVVEDNKENDYGKYQKLLREFDFFEHAIFFGAGDVTPGLEKDAVNSVRNDFILTMIINHGKIILFDKRVYYISVARFKMPFIVSCIFSNPLNSESIECLNNIYSIFKDEADKDSEKYVTELKNALKFECYFRNYYERKIIEFTDPAFTAIDLTRKIDPVFYNQLPGFDEHYINSFLSALKAENYSALPDNCYINTEGENNFVNILYQDNFRTDCEEFLKLQKHLRYVESRDADREFILREQQRLSDFRNAVLRHRLSD